MASDRALQPAEPARTGGGPHRWPVWQLPPPLLGAVLLVETIAAALLGVGLLARPEPTSAEVCAAGLIWALGAVYTEMSAGVERERRRLHAAGHVELGSVWTFAAALVLPGAHAAVVAAILTLHLWARASRRWVPLHRQLFSVATVVLACIATSEFLEYADPAAGPAERPLWVVVVAIALYMAVDAGLTAAVVAVAVPRAAPSALFRARDENALELAMLCMGALAAIAFALNPVLVALMLLPLYVVLRAVLIRPLEKAASTDGKTGLLNAATWVAEAERVLAGPDGVECIGGVLVLDLDHFKAVNDRHGHAAGDHVLAAVADALRRMVRAPDLVGRLGGEEFVVMTRRPVNTETAHGARSVELESVELEVVAERIRAHVEGMRLEVSTRHGELPIVGLTVSVGGAVPAASGSDLAALLHGADIALYAAKRAGRNTVRVAVAPESQPMPVQFAGRGTID